MPKQKQFLQPKKKSEKDKITSLKTANDYLEAGVNFEESGEKWRAGDAAKSLRFFVRAIESYDAGLKVFSESFDLAYNKARLQYDVALQERFLEHLPTSLIDLLQISLESHRYALTINPDNADLLFNTAQILTSVAETITGGKKPSEADRDYALISLQESLELFQRCLALQEFQFTQTAQETQQPPEQEIAEQMDVSSDVSDDPDSEVWAAIVEPISKDTLFDTCIAQFETLTAFCNLGSKRAQDGLVWIEEYYQSMLAKMATYGVDNHRKHGAALAKGNFVCALSEAAHRNGRIDILTYEKELNLAFNDNPDLDLSHDVQGLCEKAEAELNFNASLQSSLMALNTVSRSEDLVQSNLLAWKYVTRALNGLTAASKLRDVQNVARIQLRRGDCELLRFRLGEQPTNYELARKSASTLLNNARIYYQSARAMLGKSTRINDTGDEERESLVKQTVTAGLHSDQTKFVALVKEIGSIADSEVEDMYDEGLLGAESRTKIKTMLA